MTGSTIWLSCGVVRSEMSDLHRRGAITGELRFLDSDVIAPMSSSSRNSRMTTSSDSSTGLTLNFSATDAFA